jgi:hypothetical protein
VPTDLPPPPPTSPPGPTPGAPPGPPSSSPGPTPGAPPCPTPWSSPLSYPLVLPCPPLVLPLLLPLGWSEVSSQARGNSRFMAPDMANSSLGRYRGGRRTCGRVRGVPPDDGGPEILLPAGSVMCLLGSRPGRRGSASELCLRPAHRACALAHGRRCPGRTGCPLRSPATLPCPLAHRTHRWGRGP